MNRSAPARVAGAALAITALLTLILIAFTWPTHELAPRQLPLAVAGPAQSQAAEKVTGALGEDGVSLQWVSSREDAVAAIKDRRVYAGVVANHADTELLLAPAASPAVAQLLTATLGADGATLTQVVPLPEEDPRGAVFTSGALPLVLGGILTGVVLSMVAGSGMAALGGALAVATAAGLAVAGLLQGWLGALGGAYWANAGVVALGIAAISLTIIGLFRLLGPVGIAFGALTTMLVGNPLSGVTSAPELLPGGAVGQWLPPGAAGTALRATSFFDGAGATTPLLVLTGWAAAGALLALVGRRGQPRPAATSPAAVSVAADQTAGPSRPPRDGRADFRPAPSQL